MEGSILSLSIEGTAGALNHPLKRAHCGISGRPRLIYNDIYGF